MTLTFSNGFLARSLARSNECDTSQDGKLLELFTTKINQDLSVQEQLRLSLRRDRRRREMRDFLDLLGSPPTHHQHHRTVNNN